MSCRIFFFSVTRQRGEVKVKPASSVGVFAFSLYAPGALEDGCGFADRESAAWTCQRCRSEVSTGEPGWAPPGGDICFQSAALLPEKGMGAETSPQLNFSPHRWTLRAKEAGEALGTQVKEIEVIFVKPLKLNPSIALFCKAMPSPASQPPSLPPAPPWLMLPCRKPLACPPLEGFALMPWGPLPCPALCRLTSHPSAEISLTQENLWTHAPSLLTILLNTVCFVPMCSSA
ncbi:uncharacterized protein LOC117074721 [Trachypithecus francoisi]|uniref:uncharacterized protein LOC117074721 n=1 Tax=Trachypithecus francoisi TaxID=54180 RepID=UPI00141AA363|nr:uncharacterized protein LOC117074721 [Trachypithecus francoisi]